MIGLLGGSFDPVHHGHLLAARVLLEELALQELRLMPAAEQPFKVGQHGASAEDRTAMVALAIAGATGLAVEKAEVERPGPSYTVDTLRALQRREPGRRFVLLVGADAARDLPKWREASALPGLAEIVAFGRAGTAAAAHPLVSRTVAVPALDISATEIRRRVETGKSIRYWVPDAVADYIARRGLYRKTGE
ncbi:MAG TPA: nicotinate-nucleotide adenylyltransferase [Gemmatimonadales bacterium]|nr:nicotinate-nucleotide adenylyltransferase [Gemmatimonadales bacterium]